MRLRLSTMTTRATAAFGFLTMGTLMSAAAAEPAEIVHALYRADRPFPEFTPVYHENWRVTRNAGQVQEAHVKEPVLGGYIQVYVRNRTNQPLKILDARLEGISLTEAICFSPDKTSGIHPASVRLAKIPKEQIDHLIRAGDPIWWKAEPDLLAPGGVGNVTVRLRRTPPVESLAMQIDCGSSGLPVRIELNKSHPLLAGVTFSPGLNQVTTYVRTFAKPSVAPSRFAMDSEDMTTASTFLVDPALDTVVIITRLHRPLDRGSYHYFEATFRDGARATAGLRANTDEFRYGMWGYIRKGKTPEERAAYFLRDMEAHNINVLMFSIGGDVTDFLLSPAGMTYSQRTGMGMMANGPGKIRKPVYYFLLDEPDAHDAAVKSIDPPYRLGALAQGLVDKAKQIRARDPVAPILLNIDNTYKPENWYTYAQLPDVMCADPYYSGELASAIESRPYALPYQEKPTYVYGVSTISRWACAPRPLHIVLNCVRDDNKKHPFRFSTPVEKRIEVYYAIAAGATSLSYWWYTPYDDCYGVGGDDPQGKALWQEMGELGAEVRTAGEVLTQGCPIVLPVKSSPHLWVRTLLGGPNSVVAVVVNDTSRGTRTGTLIQPVTPATVNIRVPGWLKTLQAFEIDSSGVKKLSHTRNGDEVALDLKQVNVTRLIVLTRDTGLSARLDKTYRERFAAKPAAPGNRR